jgi:hypothetical protein
MVCSKNLNTRLSRNFHKTFVPERTHINAMLKYASIGKKGSFIEIGQDTGIPTGKSSGKVVPTLDYCRGMGLIALSDESKNNSVKQPILTDFGRIILFEDPFLKENITQWICHFNLCSPNIGADVWYQVFFKGFFTLGMSFNRKTLLNYLENIYEVQNTSIIGPLVRMYNDPASFSVCSALVEKGENYERKSAPVTDENIWGYGAWILNLIEIFYPDNNQITLTELDRAIGCKTIPGWDISDFHKILFFFEQKKILNVDRHMEPWVIQPIESSQNLWKKIFHDLI